MNFHGQNSYARKSPEIAFHPIDPMIICMGEGNVESRLLPKLQADWKPIRTWTKSELSDVCFVERKPYDPS